MKPEMKPSCSKALVRPTKHVKENSANTAHTHTHTNRQWEIKQTFTEALTDECGSYHRIKGPLLSCVAQWGEAVEEGVPEQPSPSPGSEEVWGTAMMINTCVQVNSTFLQQKLRIFIGYSFCWEDLLLFLPQKFPFFLMVYRLNDNEKIIIWLISNEDKCPWLA